MTTETILQSLHEAPNSVPNVVYPEGLDRERDEALRLREEPFFTIELVRKGGHYEAVYGDQALISGSTAAEMGRLAKKLLAAGAGPHGQIRCGALCYDIEEVLRCQRAYHLSELWRNGQEVLDAVLHWMDEFRKCGASEDMPWKTWNTQLRSNLDTWDWLIEFSDTPFGRQAEAEFRVRFQNTIVEFPDELGIELREPGLDKPEPTLP